MVDIGRPERVYTVEPLEDPVPRIATENGDERVQAEVIAEEATPALPRTLVVGVRRKAAS